MRVAGQITEHRASLFLFLLAACLGMVPLDVAATVADRPALTLQEYRAALLEVRALALAAQREKTRSGGWDPATRARLAAALPVQARVRMSPGVSVSVDNRPLARL